MCLDTKHRHFNTLRDVPSIVYTSFSQSVFHGNLKDAITVIQPYGLTVT